jgi:hypothetical protein
MNPRLNPGFGAGKRREKLSEHPAPGRSRRFGRMLLTWVAASLCLCPAHARVMDDFEDGFRTGWMDFLTGQGGAVTEAWGVLTLEVPAGRAQGPVFVATARAGERLVLEPGSTLELRAALLNASHPETFAVLAWVPDSQPLSRFAGYFLAKSATEIRIGKALHRYYLRETPSPPLKHANVTLVLSLTLQGDAVTLQARVLDLEADDAVLWERTVTDPATPWQGAGQFALFGFSELETPGAEPLLVSFERTEVNTAEPANLRPVIHDLDPPHTASFLPLKSHFTLRATDDRPWWEHSLEAGVMFGGGLFIAQTLSLDQWSNGKVLLLDALGKLQPNTNYTVFARAVDAEGASNEVRLSFDTFCPANRVIEVEDYNFRGGQFLDGPRLMPEGSEPAPDAYLGQPGVPEVDFHDQRTAPGVSRYRSGDPVATRRSLDYRRPWFVEAGADEAEVFDYDVRDIQAGEYLVYTRTFGPAEYAVYLRAAVVNLDRAEAVLERLTRTPEGGEVVTELGRFVAEQCGFEYRNVPLTNAEGRPVKVRLAGIETLRLRQLTSTPPDGEILQNYLVFAPDATECLEVVSASDPAGPYRPDRGPVITGQTITLRAMPGEARFYRVSARNASLRLVNVRRDGPLVQFEAVAP